MSDKKLHGIKRGRLQRRLAVSVAGIKATGAVLGSRSTDWLLPVERRQARRSAVLAEQAGEFVAKLGSLKGSYVKIGQLLALFGEHILPRELTDALHELEHQTHPLDWSAMQPVIKQQLGPKAGELHIEKQALAAASMGQVHRAQVRKDGSQLCLKLQYPGVADTIDNDFADVVRMLKLARWLQAGRELDALLEEVREILHDEVDYQREAEMTNHVAALLAGDERYLVPAVWPRYSATQVLALQYIDGHDVASVAVQALPLAQRNKLAEAMLELFLREVFDWGVLQSDPNFGNYRVVIKPKKNQLALLDFGAVIRLPEEFLVPLRAAIAHAYNDNIDGVIDAVVALRCVRADHPQPVKESFARFCMALLEPLRPSLEQAPDYALNRKGNYCWAQSNLMRRAAKLAAKSTFTPYFTLPPKEFALLVRKLTGVFTFISVLQAEFNGSELLAGYVQRWQEQQR